ncbi:hypothetical protein [Turneriella parva]|uniref:Transmembrane protein n=1 Tax=Turneriella parva (strain ATCC BAA-1111 / DSM 21527 / NCTC 11395 / H) TaxID=869212 RepID=I4BB57_TURPD|nr:hypothetical protein [Turneriella parva]AFM14514.1 hypothetical protein Turpa_3880 [Turneriella parva DSM 21527]
MAGRAFKIDRRETTFRLAALFWGFAFIHTLRWLLDTFFPFYRTYFALSQFALVLFIIAFTATALYAQTKNRVRSYLITLLIVVATGTGFVFAFREIGNEAAYLLLPVPLSILAIVLWYELSRHLLVFQPAKIFVLAGAAAALLAPKVAEAPWLAPAVAGCAILISRLQVARGWEIQHERLLNLRQLIDFLRYLFLAQAFHATLGQNRPNLPLVLAITLAGISVPQLIRLLGTVRPHIQSGLLFLPLIFTGLAAIFNLIHYNFWGAIAYTSLAIWESLYFAKAHEVYLRREKLLAGAALGAAFIAYYIATEWLQILSGLLVILVLTGITIYVAKAWRKTITALFAVAAAAWMLSVQWKYSNSVTRDFFKPQSLRLKQPQLPDTGLLMTILGVQKSTGQAIYTNMLPDELLGDSVWQGQNIYTLDLNPATIVLRLGYACYVKQRPNSYIFDEQSLGIYGESQALIALQKLMQFLPTCELYLADKSQLRAVRNLSQFMQTDPRLLQNITADDAAKLLSLARAVKRKDMMAEAQQLYEEVYRFYKDDATFLRELSSLAAARGLVDRQIETLNSIIALKQGNTAYDKKLLMELYALKRDAKRSAALAYEILADGAESPLAIFSFLQKLFSEPFNRTEMQSLFQKLAQYQPKTDFEVIKFSGLKRAIEDQLKQNPTYDRKFHDENHRQEFISFPE